MSRDDESADFDLRRAALLMLFHKIVWEKIRHLGYVKEMDHDPTLEKVFVYSASIILREMAVDLSALGHSHRAKHLLDARTNISIAAMQVLFDDTLVFLKDAYPGIARTACDLVKSELVQAAPSVPDRRQSLAEFRARFLATALCDDQGNRIFTDEDVPRILAIPADRLDSAYVAAAKVNWIPAGAKPTDPIPTRHLGLNLDKARLQVRRDGFPSVSLTRPLLWQILELLMENGNKFVDERSMRRAWTAGEDGRPDTPTVRRALSDLGKKLKPLNVGIGNERTFGWRLVEE